MKSKLLAVFALIILIFVLVLFWIGGIIMNDSKSDSSMQSEAIDYVIILGCKLDGEVPGRCLEARIDAAVKCLKEHPWSMAVCSGAQGSDEDITEAMAISRALLKKGIPPRRILIENKSYSTYENFANTKKLLDSRKKGYPYRVAFATNDFHVYRSRRLATYVGFEKPVAISAKTPSDLFYPNMLREIASVVVSWIKYK